MVKSSELNSWMKHLKDNKTLKQLFLYGITGIILNLLGFLVYLMVTWLGVEPKLAMTCLYGAGVLIGFFANKRIVFCSEDEGYRSFIKFLLAHIVGYGINFLILYYFYDVLGYMHQVVQFVAIFVVAVYLFVVFKFLVFKQSPLKLVRNIR